MVQLTAIALLVASACTFVQGHYMGKKDPERDYYTLKIPQDGLASAHHVAQALNVRFEGPIGELDSWYMVSSPKSKKRQEEDAILSSFHRFKNSHITKRSSPWQNVQSIDKQVLKRRTKRGPIPPPEEEFVQIQRTLNMNDPWLEKQWHLVRCPLCSINSLILCMMYQTKPFCRLIKQILVMISMLQVYGNKVFYISVHRGRDREI